MKWAFTFKKKSTTAVQVLDDSEPRPLETICGGKEVEAEY